MRIQITLRTTAKEFPAIGRTLRNKYYIRFLNCLSVLRINLVIIQIS